MISNVFAANFLNQFVLSWWQAFLDIQKLIFYLETHHFIEGLFGIILRFKINVGIAAKLPTLLINNHFNFLDFATHKHLAKVKDEVLRMLQRKV